MRRATTTHARARSAGKMEAMLDNWIRNSWLLRPSKIPNAPTWTVVFAFGGFWNLLIERALLATAFCFGVAGLCWCVERLRVSRRKAASRGGEAPVSAPVPTPPGRFPPKVLSKASLQELDQWCPSCEGSKIKDGRRCPECTWGRRAPLS